MDLMKYSGILKLSLEGEDESALDEYFSDKKGDLTDLDAIRQGARRADLWHACNYYSLEAFVPEFVDLYLNDLRNARQWDILENIDRITIDISDPEHRLTTEWLVMLVQYGKRSHYNSLILADDVHIEHAHRDWVFSMAYTWSMELLTLALEDVEWNDVLASFIYRDSAERGLSDLMPDGICPWW